MSTSFLGPDYLLSGEIARGILEQIEGLPVIDAHNHANVEEIARNQNYTDIWQVEGATDHYVWELMRKRGVPEQFITGDASNEEKWMKLAGVFEDFAGNPTYEWIHLDLRRRLGIDLLVNKDNARRIWEESKDVLSRSDKRPRALLSEMRVEVMCSTDDPVDTLEHHKVLATAAGVPRILPTWRPDKAMNVFKDEFPAYVRLLGERTGVSIESLPSLVEALAITHDRFATAGCRASDHGVHVPFGHATSASRAAEVFETRMTGKPVSREDVRDYASYMMHRFGELNAAKGWVTQVHVGAVRDYRDSLSTSLGPDTGGDVSDHLVPVVEPVKDFLNAFDGRLKVVLYSLDPNHWPTLATLTRAFGENVNLGSAWWFNDSPAGMRRQLEYIGSVDLLANFAGMVTDSRKLLSYGSRTEMFRRVLADVLGGMVDKGQIPETLAIKVARRVCYEGPKQFFCFS